MQYAWTIQATTVEEVNCDERRVCLVSCLWESERFISILNLQKICYKCSISIHVWNIAFTLEGYCRTMGLKICCTGCTCLCLQKACFITSCQQLLNEWNFQYDGWRHIDHELFSVSTGIKISTLLKIWTCWMQNRKFYLVVSSLKITLIRNSYGVLTLTKLSCLIVWPKIVNRNYLAGEKVSRSLEVLGSRTRIPKGLKKKRKIPVGRGG